MERLINILNFTLRMLLPRYPQIVLPYIYTLCYIHQYNRRRRFVCSVVPEGVIEKLVPSQVYNDVVGDVSGCLLVNSGSFGLSTSKLSFYDIAVFPQSAKLQTNRSCSVRVVEVPGIDRNTIVISEVGYFNVKQQLHIDCDNKKFEVVFRNPSSKLPRLATRASIGLMQSPLEVSNEMLDVLLSSFFETPRLLRKSDLFIIDAQVYAPHLQFSTFMQSTRFVFKVIDLECASDSSSLHAECGLIISKNYTTLSQANNQVGFIPSSKTTVLSCLKGLTPYNYKSFLIEHCPPGLNMVYDELLSSLHPFLRNSYNKIHGLRPVFLICGPRGSGKRKVINCVAKALGVNVWNVDCSELKGNVPGYTEKKIKIIFQKVKQFVPCIIALRNIDVLCKDHDGKEDSRVISAFYSEIASLYDYKNQKQTYPVFLIATCNNNSGDVSGIAPGLARAFLHVMHQKSPDETQRAAILEWILRKNDVQIDASVSLTHISTQSSGFLFEDLKALVAHAKRICYKRCHDSDTTALDATYVISQSDFDEGLELMQTAYSGAIGAPKIPAVTWSDIGGLLPLKEEIKRTITMPLQHPNLVASGLRRSGLLLYGPPGTGKTLLAKAVATECGLNFLSVKGPELLNMYVGQSEENVREVFARARAAAPCVVFFDELDALAPSRGRSGDSAGVMDRVVSQLLAEMDGMHKSTHLYLIGATNRPDLIDPALLRPGRLDKLLYVGVCEDHASQLSVMSALTRKFHLASDVQLDQVVDTLPANLTGADLFSVCSNAWLNAVKKVIHGTTGADGVVVVDSDDFAAAVAQLAPSVTAEELAYFSHLHAKLEAR